MFSFDATNPLLKLLVFNNVFYYVYLKFNQTFFRSLNDAWDLEMFFFNLIFIKLFICISKRTRSHWAWSLQFLLAHCQDTFYWHFLSANLTSCLIRFRARLNQALGVELTATPSALHRLDWQPGNGRQLARQSTEPRSLRVIHGCSCREGFS